MPPITPARSGLARSGDARSGYPILAGVRVPLYALSGVARSGATRSNYTSPHAFINVGGSIYWTGDPAAIADGLTVTPRILADSLVIEDNLNDQPNTASLTAMGFTPEVGDEIIITLGSRNNLVRLFAGTVLDVAQAYAGRRHHVQYHCSLIDYTWGLNQQKVLGYSTGTATTIAESLLAFYQPGYTALVEADLPLVEGGISFTYEDFTTCLTRLCKRVGAEWKTDYYRRVKVFTGTDTSETPPSAINVVSPLLLLNPPVQVQRDLSQYLSRVKIEGGGAQALEYVAPGETLIPLQHVLWYLIGGGVVRSGEQEITYTGLRTGGGGGLVGPGASPSGAPAAALASGSGIEDGAHDYAVTFVTGSGESLPGPRVSITVGAVAAPSSAPTAGTATIGTGPDPGSHDYAVTFVTSAGETTASPTVTRATGLTPAPSSAPTPALAVGTGVDSGQHDYAVTFVTSIGETTPSPISGQVTTGPVTSGALTDPSTAPVGGTPTAGTGPDVGAHTWAYTFTNAAGETLPSPISGSVTTSNLQAPNAPTLAPSAGSGLGAGAYQYRLTAVNAAGETTVGDPTSVTTLPAVSTPTTFSNAGVVVELGAGEVEVGAYIHKYTWRRTDGTETASSPGISNSVVGGDSRFKIPTGNFEATPANCVRVLYRAKSPAVSDFREVTDAFESGGFVIDEMDQGDLGSAMPTSNNAVQKQRVSVTVPAAGATTTSRKVYRTEVGGSTFKFVQSVSGNTETTITDALVDGSLGAEPPGTNTAAIRTVPLSGIVTGPSGTLTRKVYRTAVGSAQLKLAFTIANNSATTANDTVTDASLGANAPTSNTTATTVNYNQVSLTGIPLGDANVTQRKIYRRSGGLGLKLLTTLGDNVTTSLTDSTANAALGAVVPAVSTAYLQRIPLTDIPTGGALVTQRKIYRTAAGGAQLKLAHTLADNTITAWTDTVTDASLGANIPVVNTAAANQVALTAIPIGPSAVTSRKVYRTAAGAAQLKLLTTIADNTTTTHNDSAADATLGANVPSVDASGLSQPNGQVLAGSTTLPATGMGGFSSTGGWAVIGNGQQVIRYGGTSATGLTNIPASGIGSITASVGYNSNVTEAPVLTGIPPSGTGAILYPIKKGDDVNLVVTVTDTEAQAALAALLTTATYTHSGLIEDFLQDRRIAITEATARAEAHLALRNQIDVSLDFWTLDTNMRAGQTITVNLGAPTNVIGEFIVQQVTIQDFHPNSQARRHVRASSDRFTFADLLRMMPRAAA